MLSYSSLFLYLQMLVSLFIFMIIEICERTFVFQVLILCFFFGFTRYRTIENFAITLGKVYNYEQAIAEQQQALDWRRTNLRPNHPDIARGIEVLAALLEAKVVGFLHVSEVSEEMQDQVCGMLSQVIEIRSRCMSPRHPLLADAKAGLAAALDRFARHEQALPVWSQLIESQTNKDSSSSNRNNKNNAEELLLAKSKSGYARSLVARRRFAEALAAQDEVLAIRKRLLPPTHPDIGVAASERAETLFRLSKDENDDEVIDVALAERALALQKEAVLFLIRAASASSSSSSSTSSSSSSAATPHPRAAIREAKERLLWMLTDLQRFEVTDDLSFADASSLQKVVESIKVSSSSSSSSES